MSKHTKKFNEFINAQNYDSDTLLQLLTILNDKYDSVKQYEYIESIQNKYAGDMIKSFKVSLDLDRRNKHDVELFEYNYSVKINFINKISMQMEITACIVLETEQNGSYYTLDCTHGNDSSYVLCFYQGNIEKDIYFNKDTIKKVFSKFGIELSDKKATKLFMLISNIIFDNIPKNEHLAKDDVNEILGTNI